MPSDTAPMSDADNGVSMDTAPSVDEAAIHYDDNTAPDATLSPSGNAPFRSIAEATCNTDTTPLGDYDTQYQLD